jgi:hypothetical protein
MMSIGCFDRAVHYGPVEVIGGRILAALESARLGGVEAINKGLSGEQQVGSESRHHAPPSDHSA